MQKIVLLSIILLGCFPTFSQKTKRETLLEAHQLLGNFKWKDWKEAEKLVLPFAENGDTEAQYLMTKIKNFETNDLMRLRYKKRGMRGWFNPPTRRRVQKSILAVLDEEKYWFVKANKHDWLLKKTTSDEDSLRAQYVAVLNSPEQYPNESKAPDGWIRFSTKQRMEIMKRAAEKNILNAPFVYSAHISNDSSESLKWLKIAADNGDMEALHSLGSKYLFGEKVIKDVSKALEYLNKSLEYGSIESGTTLGLLYSKGEEVAKDLDKAIYYFEKDYENQLKLSLGYLYENYVLIRIGDIHAEKKEYNQAISKYQLVDAGSPEIKLARYKIGVIYATLGQFNKAVYWLKKSNYKDADQKLKEIRNR